MKILIAYFSQTGNTEQIAKAVCDELSGEHEVEMKKIGELDAGAVGDCEVLFVGSPTHAGGLAADAKKFLEGLPESGPMSLAGLVTHASSYFEKANFEKAIASMEEIAKQKGINYLGCFDCQGRLTPAIQPMVKNAMKLSDEEWKKRMDETDKHPDAEDEKKAREFAKEALARL